jgi:hypothetical protein
VLLSHLEGFTSLTLKPDARIPGFVLLRSAFPVGLEKLLHIIVHEFAHVARYQAGLRS